MLSSIVMSEAYIVTGASKGLGRSICDLLAENGYVVIGLARDSTELKSLGEHLKKYNNESRVLVCDMSNRYDVSEVGKQIVTDFSRIDGIIHNAGIIGPVGSMFTTATDEWNNTIMVNLLSIQHLTTILYPAMANSEHCRVTTISSGAAVNSLHSWSAYCASKAGLDMWTRSLADEGASHGISAVSVAPGIVDTGMQETIRSTSKEDFPMVEKFIEFYNNGDLVAPEVVANALFDLITKHNFEQSGKRFDVRDL